METCDLGIPYLGLGLGLGFQRESDSGFRVRTKITIFHDAITVRWSNYERTNKTSFFSHPYFWGRKKLHFRHFFFLGGGGGGGGGREN